MAPARPPLDCPEGHSAKAQHSDRESDQKPLRSSEAEALPQPVSQEELNAWRRGFTPQAEIWNGRLAMLGLSVGLTVLIVARLAHHS